MTALQQIITELAEDAKRRSKRTQDIHTYTTCNYDGSYTLRMVTGEGKYAKVAERMIFAVDLKHAENVSRIVIDRTLSMLDELFPLYIPFRIGTRSPKRLQSDASKTRNTRTS